MPYRKKIFLCLCTALFLSCSYIVSAQNLKFPPASSMQVITQELGLSKITLTYSRPNIKGREVFGAMVPYGIIWRTGASAATTLGFDHEVIISNKRLPAGTYALFTIPGEKEWTVILNNKQQQYGADAYDSSFDVLRFTVRPYTLAEKLETFNMAFPQADPASVILSLSWDKTGIRFPIAIDEEAEIQAAIDKALQGEKKPYFESAMYYYNTGKDLKKALEWMQLADRNNNGQLYYIKYWKGVVQLKLGDKVGAKASANEALKLAEKKNLPDYIRMINALIKQTEL